MRRPAAGRTGTHPGRCPPAAAGSHTRHTPSLSWPGLPTGRPLRQGQAAQVEGGKGGGRWSQGDSSPLVCPQQDAPPGTAAGRSTRHSSRHSSRTLHRAQQQAQQQGSRHSSRQGSRHSSRAAGTAFTVKSLPRVCHCHSPTKSHIWESPCFSATSCSARSFWKLSFSRDRDSSKAYSASPAAAQARRCRQGSALAIGAAVQGVASSMLLGLPRQHCGLTRAAHLTNGLGTSLTLLGAAELPPYHAPAQPHTPDTHPHRPPLSRCLKPLLFTLQHGRPPTHPHQPTPPATHKPNPPATHTTHPFLGG